MGELKKRQKVRSVHLDAFDAQDDAIKIKGTNLDDVVKGIILDYKNQKGWSTRQMARRCGLRQQTLTTYLNEVKSTNFCGNASTSALGMMSKSGCWKELDKCSGRARSGRMRG